ncbi:single-stranded DNA-binding protein [Bordetella genomosp. 11]|uniref:Single-stranded DNA-binding protein n=1 Tax=Bordetella genomosp. 11 TaxID=1416808 RepID=A0A261UT49_9BORD|nr:single-stranded DNA-binding protein [Bordetella genomosp. 11]OZI64512.1 hypothetical protein CAL28_07530 [Bordetella genomosp. 11]
MQDSLNHIHVIGELNRDAEVRYARDNQPVTTLTIITTYEYTTTRGEVFEEVQWHRAVLFYEQAKVASSLRRGAVVEVQGRLKTNKYQDRTGHDAYSTQIMVSDFKIHER